MTRSCPISIATSKNWFGGEGSKDSMAVRSLFLKHLLLSRLFLLYFLPSDFYFLLLLYFGDEKAMIAWLFWAALEESKHYCKKYFLQKSHLVSISSTFNLLFSTFYFSPFLYFGDEKAMRAWLFWVAQEESKHDCKWSLLQTSCLVSSPYLQYKQMLSSFQSRWYWLALEESDISVKILLRSDTDN